MFSKRYHSIAISYSEPPKKCIVIKVAYLVLKLCLAPTLRLNQIPDDKQQILPMNYMSV